jgi:hypothetical protein
VRHFYRITPKNYSCPLDARSSFFQSCLARVSRQFWLKELFRQTHKAEAVCAIIGAKKPVTDERPVGLGLWVLDDATRLSEEIRQIERMTPLVMSWKDGSVPAPACGKCDYCLSKSSLDVEQVAVSQRDYTV